MRLSELCSCLDTYKFFNFTEKEAVGLTNNSCGVRDGYVFVAIRGYKFDGHNFIGMAIEKGAVAIVTEEANNLFLNVPQVVVPNTRRALALLSNKFYGDPSAKMTVIGITGTNGKTTTSYLTKSIIEASGNTIGLLGTIQYQIGKRILPAKETTPESVEMQSFLAEMLENDIKHAVIEVSSHALSQHRLDGVRYRSVIFTNLSAEHLDYHKNVKNYREEKLKVMRCLSKGSFAVLNADNNSSKYFAENTEAQLIWYGIKKKTADVRAEMINVNIEGTQFTLKTPWGEKIINLKLVGRHNIYNALAAISNALCLGIDIDNVKKGVEALHKIQGRLEKIDCGQDFHVFIDYAHTHHALQSILSSLREVTAGRIILVFGCGGDRDMKKRGKMGYIAEKYSDYFWITNDNPRSESPDNIIYDIKKGIKKDAFYKIQPDRKTAIEEALSEAKRGDVVVIAGKGHERYQILKDTIMPFDDGEVAIQILKGKMDTKVLC